ncbi:MAG: YhbY family RNA-binding protein [Candidatus Njordarchaeales archaeon]
MKKPWKKIRKKLHEKPDLRVGKSGITEGIVAEARQLLKSKGIIKVKVLKNVATTKKEAKELIEKLAKEADAEIGKIIGKTAILYRKDLGE